LSKGLTPPRGRYRNEAHRQKSARKARSLCQRHRRAFQDRDSIHNTKFDHKLRQRDSPVHLQGEESTYAVEGCRSTETLLSAQSSGHTHGHHHHTKPSTHRPSKSKSQKAPSDAKCPSQPSSRGFHCDVFNKAKTTPMVPSLLSFHSEPPHWLARLVSKGAAREPRLQQGLRRRETWPWSAHARSTSTGFPGNPRQAHEPHLRAAPDPWLSRAGSLGVVGVDAMGAGRKVNPSRCRAGGKEAASNADGQARGSLRG
jgi:hypothetical protein